jgi:hypothetical protein
MKFLRRLAIAFVMVTIFAGLVQAQALIRIAFKLQIPYYG